MSTRQSAMVDNFNTIYGIQRKSPKGMTMTVTLWIFVGLAFTWIGIDAWKNGY